MAYLCLNGAYSRTEAHHACINVTLAPFSFFIYFLNVFIESKAFTCTYYMVIKKYIIIITNSTPRRHQGGNEVNSPETTLAPFISALGSRWNRGPPHFSDAPFRVHGVRIQIPLNGWKFLSCGSTWYKETPFLLGTPHCDFLCSLICDFISDPLQKAPSYKVVWINVH